MREALKAWEPLKSLRIFILLEMEGRARPGRDDGGRLFLGTVVSLLRTGSGLFFKGFFFFFDVDHLKTLD